jgi:hypothetical protein
MHLRRFSERQYKQETAASAAAAAAAAAAASQAKAFHDVRSSSLRAARGTKSQQLERDSAVHASLMRRKEEVEREELRVELALAEAARRRKGELGLLAAQDVAHGIDTFEINMKRLLKGVVSVWGARSAHSEMGNCRPHAVALMCTLSGEFLGAG